MMRTWSGISGRQCSTALDDGPRSGAVTGGHDVWWLEECGWHRVRRSSVKAAEAFQGEIVGRRFDPDDKVWVEQHRLQPVSVTDEYVGTIEAMPFWAGESVGGVTHVQPAAEMVRELTDDAEDLLCRWA